MRGYTGDQRVENLGEYASEAVYKDFPNPAQFIAGVEPRSTLPAKWWNWFQGKSTKNISLTAQAFLDLYGELNNLFARAGIVPGVSGDVTPQLHSVLQALFYANPNQDSRRVSANKTIDTTNALVEKLYVDTSGIIITFPDITGLTTLQYKHCEILNVSSGTITLTFPGSSGLGDIIIPSGGFIEVRASKKSDGAFSWVHTWHYSHVVKAHTPISADLAGRIPAATPISSDQAANKEYVDTHAALNGSDAHGAVAEATPLKLITRDSSGRAKVASPSADADIATKGYIDAKVKEYAKPVGDTVFQGPNDLDPGTLWPGTVWSDVSWEESNCTRRVEGSLSGSRFMGVPFTPSISVSGGIPTVNIVSGGSGYLNGGSGTLPLVITGPCAQQAVMTANVESGVITSITVNQVGTGYTSGKVAVYDGANTHGDMVQQHSNSSYGSGGWINVSAGGGYQCPAHAVFYSNGGDAAGVGSYRASYETSTAWVAVKKWRRTA